MMILSRLAGFSLLSSIVAWSFATAAPVRVGHVEAELIAEPAAIQPGATFAVGLRLKMDEHWHTYWQNSGDSGLATAITWKLPPGFSAGDIAWPVPQRILTPPLVSYGYEHEVLLIVDITAPENLPAGSPVTLEAQADWLVCREECVPGDAALSLTLPVTDGPSAANPATAAPFAAARARHPIDGSKSWPASFTANGNAITLQMKVPSDATITADEIYFYPATLEAIAPAGPQIATLEDGRLTIQLTKHEYAEKIPDVITGVLARKDGAPLSAAAPAIALTAASGTGLASATGATLSMKVLLSAFLGGLILNLMPCVFPVLGVKILGFVNQAGADRRKVTMHGLVFTAGVLLSFWALAGALIALRAGGQELGWGFQLQSPGFVFGLAVFLLAFGLNLSGTFEFGLSATSVGGSLQMRSGYNGSFFTGVLATIVSTPCAAPFLAPALGAALALPAVPSLLLFTVIALGLSVPYLFLSIFPQFVKQLPRPGAWMETFKQLMAFPLYATVAYLVYVLAGQVDEEVFLVTLIGFVLVALGLWGYGRWTQHGAHGRRRVFGYAFAFLCVAAGLGFGYPRGEDSPWQEWRPGLAEQLRDDGKIVYVDFTARWCATCKVNKLAVLSTEKIEEEFERRGIVRLKADWTRRDPEITRALATFGRSAVPVNVIYAPGLEKPLLLPEILTEAIVLEAFDTAASAQMSAR